jgi:hypothetical protein
MERVVRALGLIAVFTLLGAGLSGCNMVYSSKPIFTAADAAGGPVFRDGVWAAPEPGCQFDPNKPEETWPKCANGVSRADMKAGENYLAISGDPVILQVGGVDEDKTANYVYGAVKTVGVDAQGRIVAFRLWAVQCGPPNKSPATSKSGKTVKVSRVGTRHPLPGLTMDADGNNCTPADQAAIRSAAIASRAWASDLRIAAWVRDGDH